MKKKLTSFIIILLSLFVLVSCSKPEKTDRIRIVTTIFPQYSFTKEIVGDLCDVEVILKPGQDSHSYDPSVNTIISVKKADMFIYTCDEMEVWATKLIDSLEKNTVVKAAKGIQLEIVAEEQHEHEHGEEHHEHKYDPHVWTSIKNCIVMVRNIMTSICALDPDNSNIYTANGERYIKELEQMDKKFTDLFNNSSTKELFFVSPFTFYYFIKDYGLTYHSLYKTCSTEVEPSAQEIINFIDLMKKEDVKYIYKKEFMSNNIPNKIIDQTGAKLRVLHSGSNVTNEDYANNLRYIDILEQNYKVLCEGLK